jgi:hypothetical protein
MRRNLVMVLLLGLMIVALFPLVDRMQAATGPMDHDLQAEMTATASASLRLQYMTLSTVSTTYQVKPQFRIVNSGSTSVPLIELTIRYYFTIDSASPLTFNCDYALLGCANLSASFVPVSPAGPGADYYLELSFTSVAGSIAPGYTSGPIQVRFNKDNWTTFNQGNDYSFDPTKSAFADWTRVTLYRNGVLVWGLEPLPNPTPTASFTPTAMPTTAAPTFVPASVTPMPTTTAATNAPTPSNPGFTNFVDFNKYPDGTSVNDFSEPNLTFTSNGGGLTTAAMSGAMRMYGGGIIVTVKVDRPVTYLQFDWWASGACAQHGTVELYRSGALVDTTILPYCSPAATYRIGVGFDSIIFRLEGVSNTAQSIDVDNMGLIIPGLSTLTPTPNRTLTPTRTPTFTPTSGPTLSPTPPTPSLTPTTTPTWTLTPTLTNTPIPTLRLQYMTLSTVSSTYQVKPQFRIVNTGSTSVPLSELEIRYYFTIDSAAPLTFNCDYALVGCANLSASFVPVNPGGPGTDYYLELSFTSGAGSIAPGYTSGPIQVRFNKDNWTTFNQGNDYSFDPTKSAFADWNRVTLYRNGTLIWGVEPVTGPPPTGMPTITLIPTSTPTPTPTSAAPTFQPIASTTPRPTSTTGGFD